MPASGPTSRWTPTQAGSSRSEGAAFWIIRTSPISLGRFLWSKFWIGTLPLLILALGIVFVTNVLLQVSPFMMFVSLFSITLLTFALAGLALLGGVLGNAAYDLIIAAEEICAVDPGFACTVLVNGLGLLPVWYYGTDENAPAIAGWT